MIKGIDVSKWQGISSIDWPALRAAGVEFAFIKATEGALAPGTDDATAIAQFGLDPAFRWNWNAAQLAGIARGAYHFARPDLGNTPEAEADWFLSVVNPPTLATGDMLAVDGEMGAGQYGSWYSRCLGQVRAGSGYPPLLYGSPNYLARVGVTFAVVHGSYGLWLAEWPAGGLADGIPAPPAGWPVVAFWQYGSAGALPGLGRCDGDVFNGTTEQLALYGKPAPPEKPKPIPPPAAVYSFHALEWAADNSISVGGRWIPWAGFDLAAWIVATGHGPDVQGPLSDAKQLADWWAADQVADPRELAMQVLDAGGQTVYAAYNRLYGHPQP
jgi:lysozyme